ncbi:MAG: hypothetical protein PHP86_19795 [Nevskiales bacterium]|nr:hypothetical protein [Nevskiales bacterium]
MYYDGSAFKELGRIEGFNAPIHHVQVPHSVLASNQLFHLHPVQALKTEWLENRIVVMVMANLDEQSEPDAVRDTARWLESLRWHLHHEFGDQAQLWLVRVDSHERDRPRSPLLPPGWFKTSCFEWSPEGCFDRFFIGYLDHYNSKRGWPALSEWLARVEHNGEDPYLFGRHYRVWLPHTILTLPDGRVFSSYQPLLAPTLIEVIKKLMAQNEAHNG